MRGKCGRWKILALGTKCLLGLRASWGWQGAAQRGVPKPPRKRDLGAKGVKTRGDKMDRNKLGLEIRGKSVPREQ